MRAFFFGLFITSACMAREQGLRGSPEDKEIQELCEMETNYDGNFWRIREDASKEAKCFASCFMKAKGMINADGSMNVNVTKTVVEKRWENHPDVIEKLLKAADECSEEVKPDRSNLCESAFKYIVCQEKKVKN